MRRSIRIVLASIVFTCIGFSISMSISACKTLAPSRLSHDFGRVAPKDAHSFYWTEVSTTDLSAWLPELGRPVKFKPSSSLLAQRLNEWAKEIHKILVKRSNITAPEPVVLISPYDDLNAFATPIATCIDMKINFQGSPATATQKYFLIKPKMAIIDTSFKTCIEKNLDSAEKKALIGILFKKTPQCFSFDESGSDFTVNLSKDCFVDPEQQKIYQSVRGVEELIYLSTANRIVFYEPLLKNLKETMAVVVLAHELAHYYMAHGSETADTYDFPYLLDEKHNVAEKPQPLPPDHALTDLVKRLDGLRKGKFELNIVYDFPIEGQQYASQLFAYFADQMPLITKAAARDCAGNAACTSSCTDFAKHMNAESVFNTMYGFPAAPLRDTNAARTFYKTYETLAKACSKNIKYDAVFSDDLSEMGVEIDSKKINAGKFATLDDFATFLTKELPAAIKAQNSKIEKLYLEADEARLGHYTSEQEADELSLEIVARLGIDGKNAPLAYLTFQQILMKNFPRLYGQKYAESWNILNKKAQECVKAYQNKFESFVPVGDYADRSHHDSCYRAYNLEREYTAHQKDLEAIVPQDVGVTIDEAQWKTYFD